tara:strand:- start:72 stop:398 length:327 start_codon:yes stop_codon:yes gene_type:complete
MVDKQKEWKKNDDKKSMREYNNWKQTNFRDKKGILREKKVLTPLQIKQHLQYLKNREKILKEYHAKKPYVWIDVNIEDREFVLNFNPKDFPKYLEEVSKIKHSFIIGN